MRRRIVALSVLAAVLAITLFGVPLAYGVAQSFLGDERDEAERAADRGAISAAADLARGDRPTDLASSDSAITVGLYGTDGARLAGVGPAVADRVVRGAMTRQVTRSADVHGQLV